MCVDVKLGAQPCQQSADGGISVVLPGARLVSDLQLCFDLPSEMLFVLPGPIPQFGAGCLSPSEFLGAGFGGAVLAPGGGPQVGSPLVFARRHIVPAHDPWFLRAGRGFHWAGTPDQNVVHGFDATPTVIGESTAYGDDVL